MSNQFYTAFRQGVLDAGYDLNTATIAVAAVSGYTFNATHATIADVVSAGGVINASSGAITNPVITGGVFNGDSVNITTTASTSNHILIVYQASAVTGGANVAQGSQKLILYIDTSSDASIPFKPGDGVINITWDTGASKILKVG